MFMFADRDVLIWNVQAGEFKTLVDIMTESCVLEGTTEDVAGAEDLHFIIDGSVFLSTGDRSWWGNNTFSNVSFRAMHAKSQGSIFIFNPASQSPKAGIRLSNHESSTLILGSSDFQPHGISLYPRVGYPAPDHRAEQSRDAFASPAIQLLYVVNHRRDGEVIDIFEIDGRNSRLMPKASVRSRLFLNLNDVAAVSGGFYTTNYHYHLPFTHPLSIAEVTFKDSMFSCQIFARMLPNVD